MSEQQTQPENHNQQSTALLKAVDFGFQVEAFLASEIGQYLIKRADDEVESAVALLKQVDPEDAKAIRHLQSQVRVAESVQYWLADAINAGINAQDELIDQAS